ncbi:MAG: glycosyltransferase family 4 protein [Treponema sp.]|uniref:glycosyltransferase family 4 protein n=1 Tax=Treponema sp. TaxID=166 RepID=UPI0025CE21AA|nr:glycosyltransferase family 1 protein [Treponema sp.]MBR0496218.1 glycosyltransferase family 4 protein [Treponema sp.]
MLKSVLQPLGDFYHPLLHNFRQFLEAKRIINEINLRIKNDTIVSKNLSRKKRIYLDVADFYLSNRGTGIQRVTKEISEGIHNLCTEYDVIDVYCKKIGYTSCIDGKDVDFCQNDILLVLGYTPKLLVRHAKFFEELRNKGIWTAAFLYDLLPILYPSFFISGEDKKFRAYLSVLLQFSQLICDSSAVASEVKQYLETHPKIKRNPELKISYSLLGSDFSTLPRPSVHFDSLNSRSGSSLNFLMVSTVEPRKMYAQAVKAFDMLWKEGLSVNLWIVGRRGWKNETTFRLIEENTHYGKELVWYSTGISDEELASLYEKCDAVIFASVAEGFGLAVAEGAHFGKPLILRDIPVFREIAGNNAFYFSGTDESILAGKIKEWISLYKTSKEPKSTNIKLTSWKECSQKVLDLLTGNGEKS